MAARGVNKVIILGNVGKDPETRYMPNGNAVTNLSIATSEKWTDKNSGNEQEKTEWHRVVFYGRLAEVVDEYVKKGAKIYIEGKLQTRKWEQDGVDRYATEIIAHELQMLDTRGGSDDGPSTANSRPAKQTGKDAGGGRTGKPAGYNADDPRTQRTQRQQPEMDSFDDDIPFN
jgi:single-strand DNA-binding protein